MKWKNTEKRCASEILGQRVWIILALMQETYLQGFANNKSADQPAHPRSLIGTFAIRFLECFISKLATSEISIYELASVTEETGLNLTLSEALKTDFVASRPIFDANSFHVPLTVHNISRNLWQILSKFVWI